MELRLYKSKNNIHVRGQGSNPHSTTHKKLGDQFFGLLFSHLVIYCANVWNEREANNVREKRDFEDDKVKSHIYKAFFCSALQLCMYPWSVRLQAVPPFPSCNHVPSAEAY